MVTSLPFAIQNQSDSSQVYAYVTGIANGQFVLIKANGKDLYYPESPPNVGSPLAQDCAIPLGPPNSTITITVPQIAGGRLWISVDSKLTFLLNPGPALVEPSVLNPADPNAHVNFGFAEFTLNNDQLYANISYVDFVPRVPIALTLQNTAGAIQHVSGMPQNGLDQICAALRAQAQSDGRPWDKLIVQNNGQNLRALNPSHGDAVGANFAGYYEPYVDQVWQKYSENNNTFQIDTQAGPGVLSGRTQNGQLEIGNEAFQKPSTADIFGSNSGPFTTGSDGTRNAIIPRLAAGFNRSTFLNQTQQPSDPSTFYLTSPTNHYSRIVHEYNLDHKGYGFAYDDVQPESGVDQSGKVNDGSPALFTIAVGGKNAYVGNNPPETNERVVEQEPSPAQPAPQQQQQQQQPLQQDTRPEMPEKRKSSPGGLRGKINSLRQKFMR